MEVYKTPSKKLIYRNIAKEMRRHKHGSHAKDMFVTHETVSKDIAGWSDILANEGFLAEIDYGIHGLNDKEGHMAWAYGLGNAIFYQAGGANERSVGCEQVSNIPTLIQKKLITHEQAWHSWLARETQLRATAKMIACWHNSDPKHHPIRYSDGNEPGVCSHWDVSQHHPESKGHWDCWPHHRGGYYPILTVINFAEGYAKLGYHF